MALDLLQFNIFAPIVGFLGAFIDWFMVTYFTELPFEKPGLRVAYFSPSPHGPSAASNVSFSISQAINNNRGIIHE